MAAKPRSVVSAGKKGSSGSKSKKTAAKKVARVVVRRSTRRPRQQIKLNVLPVAAEIVRKIDEVVYNNDSIDHVVDVHDNDALMHGDPYHVDSDVEHDIDDSVEIRAVKSGRRSKIKKVARKDALSPLQTVFDLNEVDDPLIGTPKEVQEELDGLALRMQKDPDDQDAFERILTYIHKYLLGLVFKKYNFIKGYEESDIYQEALIALFKKAVPKFDPTRNMSFLNFAKMCINRHLITILHASKHRRKDMPINNSISLDHNPGQSGDEDDGNCSLSNIIPDEKSSSAPYKDLAKREAFARTLEVLKSSLSQFEIIVIEEYLAEKSYREAAKSVTRKTGIRYNEKSVDNALLRIRKKALEILRDGDIENIPLLY
jgi:RNA polymerase sporulation-specific sigma factor